MKRLVLLLLAMVLGFALTSVAWADCDSECDGPYQTCMRICSQTTKEYSTEATACIHNCLRGLNGCHRRCEERNKDKKSEVEIIKETVLNQQQVAYHGFCSKCNYSWDSETKPTKCPNCGNVAIVISKNESNYLYAQIPDPPCVCAYCGWKCGTGHASNCIYKPKAKPEIIGDLETLNINTGLNANCIEQGLQCTLHGTPCCAPYECKGKFPNTYCQ